MDSVRIEPVADEESGGGIPYNPKSKWSAEFPFELLIDLPIGLYVAFVAQCFWNWFVVPALRLPEISFLHMLGLWWMIALLIRSSAERQMRGLVFLLGVIGLCVPPERTRELEELMDFRSLEELLNGLWQIIRLTLTLALGFGLHLLIS